MPKKTCDFSNYRFIKFSICKDVDLGLDVNPDGEEVDSVHVGPDHSGTGKVKVTDILNICLDKPKIGQHI